MSFELITEIEGLLAQVKAKFKPEIKAAENAGHAIVTDAASYIQANGLHDLEQIALTLVSAMVPGASWTGVLASIEAQAIADGKAIIQGSVAIVGAKAQADLLAVGKPAGLPAA